MAQETNIEGTVMPRAASSLPTKVERAASEDNYHKGSRSLSGESPAVRGWTEPGKCIMGSVRGYRLPRAVLASPRTQNVHHQRAQFSLSCVREERMGLSPQPPN